MDEKERLTWDEYFSKIVMTTSERSPCERLQVGCLLVKDNRIVSQGYNGFLPGCPHNSVIRNNHEQATVHAEQNAISDCAKRGVNCDGAISYITHYPCIICARILLASGIKEIESNQKKRRSALEKKIQRLKDYLRINFEKTNTDRLESEDIVIAIYKNPIKVNVVDEDLIPEEFFNIKENKVLNKDMIKDVVKRSIHVIHVKLI